MAQQLKKAAMERVFGFEILPAPFVVAHLQLGLMLKNLNAPLSDKKNERVGVYLTNALTGWEPEKKPKDKLPFPELQEEHDAAEKVKCDVPILVILGNPPYNAFAGISPEEEELVEDYKGIYYEEKSSKRGGPPYRTRRYRLNDPESKDGWGIKKFNLDDLYIRFFRIAERRVVKGGKGIVSYISNFSYLGDPSFVTMRERFLEEFDELWFDCMNGDCRETRKTTQKGKPNPSVFSTEQNKQGIRVGTTISLMIRKEKRRKEHRVRFRHFWGTEKRKELLDSLRAEDINREYKISKPAKSNRYSFRPSNVTEHYLGWPKLLELSLMPAYNGPVERRALTLISIDRNALMIRMKKYFDKTVSNQEIASIYPSLMMTGNRIIGPEARAKIMKGSRYDENCIVRYPFKPYDIRWCYLENLRPLFSEPSPQLLKQRSVPNNAFFLTRDTADKKTEGPPFLFARLVCDYDCVSGHARHFPIRLCQKSETRDKNNVTANMFGDDVFVTANLSIPVRSYLKSLGIRNPDKNAETAGLIWMHALAVGYSPAYLSENADGVRQDWPRIPLPDSEETLLNSAALGSEVAALLDTETHVRGVTGVGLPARICGLSAL